ncbi:MAG: VOC family protein [Microbacterium sp.]
MTAFDHIGLSVGDLDTAVAWYVEALGLVATEPFAVPSVGVRGQFVVDPHDHWAIELLERAGSDGGIRATSAPEAMLTRGFGHICLRVPSVDAVYERLVAAGASERMSPCESPEPGVRMAFVADPEGNLIELHDRAGHAGSASFEGETSHV